MLTHVVRWLGPRDRWARLKAFGSEEEARAFVATIEACVWAVVTVAKTGEVVAEWGAKP